MSNYKIYVDLLYSSKLVPAFALAVAVFMSRRARVRGRPSQSSAAQQISEVDFVPEPEEVTPGNCSYVESAMDGGSRHTEISCHVVKYVASATIDLSPFSLFTRLQRSAGDPLIFKFSGGDTDEKEWYASLYFGSGTSIFNVSFHYTGSKCYVLEGIVTISANGSALESFPCKPGILSISSTMCCICSTSSFFIPNGDCDVSFRVKYLKERVKVEAERCFALSSPGNHDAENLHFVYADLFSSGKYPDMSFVVGDQVIPAHKVIVTARVPYFDKMMSSGMEEAESSCVKLDDGVDVAAFKEVLKYVYGGQLPTTLDKDAVQILPLADQYDLQRLKEACFYHMEKGLAKENICDTLILADFYRGADLKKKCLKSLHQWGSSLESKFLEKLKEHPQLMIEVIQSK